MTNPTARSKRRLEQEGYTVGSTEKWIPQVRRRVDLFGFADLVAIRAADGAGLVAVQSTSASNLSARVKKIIELEAALTWLRAAPGFAAIVVHGWAKRGARGKRKVWECRERWITVEDFMSV
jgi:hypothetical protein